MSNSVFGISKRTLKPLCNKQSIEVHVATYICNIQGDYQSWKQSWPTWNLPEDAMARCCVRKEESFRQLDKRPMYFVEILERDLHGQCVYHVPDTGEQYFGVHDEYDLEGFSALGVLVKMGNRYQLITSKQEQLNFAICAFKARPVKLHSNGVI